MESTFLRMVNPLENDVPDGKNPNGGLAKSGKWPQAGISPDTFYLTKRVFFMQRISF
jgi:hypothetical protein